MCPDQLAQFLVTAVEDPRWPEAGPTPWTEFAGLASSLLDTANPGRTDRECLSGFGGFHAVVASAEHPSPQIKGVSDHGRPSLVDTESNQSTKQPLHQLEVCSSGS